MIQWYRIWRAWLCALTSKAASDISDGGSLLSKLTGLLAFGTISRTLDGNNWFSQYALALCLKPASKSLVREFHVWSELQTDAGEKPTDNA